MRRLIFLAALTIALSGCTGVMPGVGYPLKDQRYSNFIGKKYEVIAPLRVMKFTCFGGGYFLARPEIKEDSETKKVADVPPGAIIIADHVSRLEHIALGTSYSYVGKFQTPGIFNGGFDLVSFMQWSAGGGKKGGKVRPREEINFKNEFKGMDSNYLRELP